MDAQRQIFNYKIKIMTPKEKAKELVDKMAFEVCKTDAKQCALITVDEIQNRVPLISNIQEYWIEVKREIIKL